MSNQEAKKLNRLTVNKETIQDLEAPNAGDVKGGVFATNGCNTRQLNCVIVPKTAAGETCDTVLNCVVRQ